MSKKRKLIKREETISKLATLQSRKAFRDVYKEIDNLEEKVENGVGGIASIQTSNTGNVKFTGDGTAENPLKAEANVDVNIDSISTIQTAEQLNALADGLYFANGAGVYNISISNPTTGVTVANGKTTVASGYSVSFNKKGNVWSLASSVSIPSYELPTTSTTVKGGAKIDGDTLSLVGDVLGNYNETNVLLNIEHSNINFDLNNRKIIFSGGVILYKANASQGRITIPSSTVDMPTGITNAVVVYDKSTSAIVIRNQTVASISKGLQMFAYQFGTDQSKFRVNGIDKYSVNGIPFDTQVKQRNALLNVNPSHVNFDLPNRLIKFSGGAIIDDNGISSGRFLIAAQDVAIPSSIPSGVVLYDKVTSNIVVKNQSSPATTNHLQMFTYYYAGAYENFVVNGIDNYSVNGVAVSNKIKDLRQGSLFSVDNFAIPYYEVSTQQGVQEGQTPTVIGMKSNDLYTMYDSLVSGVSGVVKTKVGTTDSNLDVYRIDVSFNTFTASTERRNKPRIFITGGTHGGERLAVWETYLLVKNLINNPSNSEMIAMLRTNFDFTIIPLVNPYAFDFRGVDGSSSVRWNHNKVDINRQFDYQWDKYSDTTIGSQFYKGTTVFGEKESQFVKNVFDSLTNVVLHLDIHNYGEDTSDSKHVWMTALYNNAINIYQSLCDRLDWQNKKKWNYITKRSAWTSISNDSPTMSAWIANQGILSCTFEINEMDAFNTSGEAFNSNVVTRGLENLINTIYSLSRKAVDFYNK